MRVRAQRQRDTRRRIVAATVALHEEVGPARTTVAEIARRAGVQRLTVYAHFPDEAELFAACQRHFMSDHPLPDLTEALSKQEPVARVRATLAALYASYRDREPMTAKVLRDRGAIPALDELLRRTMDAQLNHLVDELGKGFRARGKAATRLAATLTVALDFSTWRRLNERSLEDADAAALMAELVRCAAHPRQ